MNVLTPEEVAAVKVKIKKLELTYEELLTGTAIKKFVDQNGEQIEYSTANLSGLLTYINSLKASISGCFARAYRPRPMGFIFPRQ